MVDALQLGCKFAINAFDIYIKVKLLNVLFKNKLYDKSNDTLLITYK